MLEKLNSKIQGWFAWIIISMIAFTFAIFGIEHYMQSRSANLAKAEVNGKAITMRDFDLQYRRQQRLHEPLETNAAAERKRKLEMVEQLIKQHVMLQSAAADGFYVSTNQANAQIQAIPQFQEDGHFSLGRYQQAINNALFSPESFLAEVKDELLLNQQRFAFSGTAFVLPYEVKQFVELFNQTRDYDYLLIPYQSFLQTVKVDDKAINDYYQQHQDNFKTPEKVAIEYVQLSMPAIREKIQVSDEQVKRYYDENKSNYVSPAEWHVAHILFALSPQANLAAQQKVEEKANHTYEMLQKSPTQFAELAKTLSDDKLSALKAGELPKIIAGQSEFDKSLLDLTKPGQLSKPIKTAHGFEIFKLIDYKPSQTKSFDTVKQDIKNQLIADEVQTHYAKDLEQIADLAYQSPDTLEPISQALHLPIKQSEAFSRNGVETDLAKHKNVLNTAFSQDVLSQGNNSDPIQLDNETVIVLRVLKHWPAAEKPLAAVHEEIKQLLKKQLAEQEAKKLGEQLLMLKGNSAEEKQLLTSHHLLWKDRHQVHRSDNRDLAGLNDVAFQISRIGAVSGSTMKNGDYVLVKLLKIDKGQLKSLSKEQIASITQNMQTSLGVADFDLYQKGLLNQASVIRY